MSKPNGVNCVKPQNDLFEPEIQPNLLNFGPFLDSKIPKDSRPVYGNL